MRVRYLGVQNYDTVFRAMRFFTHKRPIWAEDELWVLQHLPVFTLGKAGKKSHILAQTSIPIVQSDRGGQITYHGPGQLVVYTLINFAVRSISVRELVNRLEKSLVITLAHYKIAAYSEAERPGVYVDGKKIASLGLRICHQNVYHGLSLNVNMDLTPFLAINPCGYPGQEIVDMKRYLNPCPSLAEVAEVLVEELKNNL